MDENKEIEEMARVACEHFDCDIVGQPCTKCKTYDKHCYTIHQAEILYNAGYRKLPEDSVALSKEEYDNLKLELQKAHNKGVRVGFDMTKFREQSISKKAVKEFAEKLQKELPCRDYTFNGNTYSMILTSSMKYVIDKLLKEYE